MNTENTTNSNANANATNNRRTPAQQQASRRNGALSRGPVTPAGKAAVRFNALKHGAKALSLVLPGEDPAEFEARLDSLIATHSPANPAQFACLERIAAAEWRYGRSLALETATLELTMRKMEASALQSVGPENAASPAVLASLAELHLFENGAGALEFNRRQQARLRREIEANYRLLTRLQTPPPKP
ncbi:MAG: hypothetical protein K2Q23_10755 [Bryobacteraceae bacterium]|nr:hypothetical protein [Bryobacteraceae bacterium]